MLVALRWVSVNSYRQPSTFNNRGYQTAAANTRSTNTTNITTIP